MSAWTWRRIYTRAFFYDPIISLFVEDCAKGRRVDDEAIGSDECILGARGGFPVRGRDGMGWEGGCMMDVNCGNVSSFPWGRWLG